MAGIYIKGMQMPESGFTSSIKICWTGEVFMETPAGWEIVAIAIPLPDHGDLIDRDVMLQEIKAFRYGNGNGGYTYASKAPTVLPADREGEA